MIQEREFVKLVEPVLKIGRTDQPLEARMQGYPKGSKILMCCVVTDGHQAELELKNEFEANFEQRKDIGSEYFEGDIREMCQLFQLVCEAHA